MPLCAIQKKSIPRNCLCFIKAETDKIFHSYAPTMPKFCSAAFLDGFTILILVSSSRSASCNGDDKSRQNTSLLVLLESMNCHCGLLPTHTFECRRVSFIWRPVQLKTWPLAVFIGLGNKSGSLIMVMCPDIIVRSVPRTRST
jgi:hypothetical protein